MKTMLFSLFVFLLLIPCAFSETNDDSKITHLQSSQPQIEGRNILISTHSITSPTQFSLYFTFVFDRNTNTPDRPIYGLQGYTIEHARQNHEAAEEWAVLQIHSIPVLYLGDRVHYVTLPEAPPLITREYGSGHRRHNEASVDNFEVFHDQETEWNSIRTSIDVMRSGF